jgi:hypothetical protein
MLLNSVLLNSVSLNTAFTSLLLALSFTSPAIAGWTNSYSVQVQLSSATASGTAKANYTDSYGISGNGVSIIGPLNDSTKIAPPAGLQVNLEANGGAFSFLQTYTPADNMPTSSININNGVLPPYSNLTLQAPSNTVGQSGSITNLQGAVTAGGAGTSSNLTVQSSFSVF